MLAALQSQLLLERPNATAGQIRALLDGLRKQGALLTDLRPPLTGDDPIKYLLDRLTDLTGCDDVQTQLLTVQNLGKAYDREKLGNGAEILGALRQSAELADGNVRSHLEVDLAIAYDHKTFPRTVVEELSVGCGRSYYAFLPNPLICGILRSTAGNSSRATVKYGKFRSLSCSIVTLVLVLHKATITPPLSEIRNYPRQRNFRYANVLYSN